MRNQSVSSSIPIACQANGLQLILLSFGPRGECYMMMSLYCVAPEERRLKTN